MKKIIFFLCFLFVSSFVCAQEVSSNIKGLLSNKGKILFGDESNSIVVIDYPQNLERIAEYLDALDVSPQQVLIEARVVEVKLQKEHALGVNWQAFAEKGGFELGQFRVGSTYPGAPGPLEQKIGYKTTYYPPAQSAVGEESPFTIAIFDDNINIVLKALANSLDTNILSAPRVTTVNNREAEIKIIKRLPWAEPQATVSEYGTVTVSWSVHFEEEGIILKVTPTINEDGKIIMILKPEVSENVGDFELKLVQGGLTVPYKIPVIDKRTASTKVVIGNGQTLIIGGLIKDKTTKGITKVPLFGDIPGLGWLFKSKKDTKDKTELLIFVSPTIITPDEFVRMAKQERYGIGKGYIEDREMQAQMLLAMEAEEKAERDKLVAELEGLAQRQKALVEERKGLEKKITEEEKGLGELKETKKAVVEKRKELERKESR